MLVASILAGLGGLIVGVFATAVHQAAFRVASGVELPWGLVLAEALVVVYLLGIRLRFESRVPVLVAAVTLVLIAGLALLPALNGSVVVPANWMGTVWSLAPGITALVIVAWPRFARRTGTEA